MENKSHVPVKEAQLEKMDLAKDGSSLTGLDHSEIIRWKPMDMKKFRKYWLDKPVFWKKKLKKHIFHQNYQKE